MAASCQNCGTSLSCGCQKRTASNGASVCAHCITDYEATLIKLAKKTVAPINNVEETIWTNNNTNE